MEEELRYVAIELPEEYIWVMMVASLLSVEALLLGCILPSKARSRTYLKPEIMEKIAKLHLEGMGREPRNVIAGYPDHGTGRFSTPDILSYSQWLEINKAQRIHRNFLEQLPVAMVLTLVSGFELPIISCIVSGLFAISRLLYMLPNRGLGFITGNLCLILLSIGALFSSGKLVADILKLE